MDSTKIEQLLQQYFEGETTLSEEQQLKQYFSSENIAPALEKYKCLFNYLTVAQAKTLSAATSNKIEEILSPPQYQPSDKSREIVGGWKTTKKLRNWILRSAAVLVLGSGLWWATTESQKMTQPTSQMAQKWEEDTEESPEEAYEKAKAALALVSKKMKKGTKTVTTELAKVKKSAQIIQ